MPYADDYKKRDWDRSPYAKILAKDRKRRMKHRKREYVWEVKSRSKCVDCGESDPVVLQFDHVEGMKKFAMSDARDKSWSAIDEELSKCDVRCANCHQKATFRRLKEGKTTTEKVSQEIQLALDFSS